LNPRERGSDVMIHFPPEACQTVIPAGWFIERLLTGIRLAMSTSSSRVRFPDVPGAGEILTPDFLEFLCGLNDAMRAQVDAARAARIDRLRLALRQHTPPGPLPPSEATTQPWQVPALPHPLTLPGIEISGPASITSMMIQALNPGPEGERAVGYLDDDEDSGGHSLADTVQTARNRKAALDGTLSADDPQRGRSYRVEPGPLPFFMHRERGLYLDEHDLTIDGRPVPASLLGIAATLFHAGALQAERGESINFYLPKTESVNEVRLYRAVFDHARERLPHLAQASIRAIILVESLPAAFEMEEMLFALGPYGAGLNAARWDLKASLIEYAMTNAAGVWPDRFDVDIKTTPFLANLFRRLVAVCLRHGAVPIGGMATALPSRDEAVNRQAAEAIRADKEWEARQGFRRGWVAHIHHMAAAARPFVELANSGWKPSPEMADPANFPLRIETPAGAITELGTRRNLRTMLEYLEGWLRGRGAKGIDSMAGRPGARPALMEDLATARISVAQTAQRIMHESVCADTGRRHSAGMVKAILDEERTDILARLGDLSEPQIRARYECSFGIAQRWIRNYTELDFRSLGSYPRAELEAIGRAPDAL
jgi:malate synthase